MIHPGNAFGSENQCQCGVRSCCNKGYYQHILNFTDDSTGTVIARFGLNFGEVNQKPHHLTTANDGKQVGNNPDRKREHQRVQCCKVCQGIVSGSFAKQACHFSRARLKRL